MTRFFGAVLFMVAIAAVSAAVPLPGERTVPDKGLREPGGLGYCVTVHENGELVGITEVPYHRPEKAKMGEFLQSVRNAVSIYRQVGKVEWLDSPDLVDQAVKRKKGGAAYCSCTDTIWSGGSPGKGSVTGCGGPCGSCVYCAVVSKGQ